VFAAEGVSDFQQANAPYGMDLGTSTRRPMDVAIADDGSTSSASGTGYDASSPDLGPLKNFSFSHRRGRRSATTSTSATSDGMRLNDVLITTSTATHGMRSGLQIYHNT